MMSYPFNRHRYNFLEKTIPRPILRIRVGKVTMASNAVLTWNDLHAQSANHTNENHNGVCSFKKYAVKDRFYRRNQYVVVTVFVHVRKCTCNYSNMYPDRSSEHLNWKDELLFSIEINERNGVEFHLNEQCRWVSQGDNLRPTLKRICFCGRYISA